jgi:hypothetical protein
MTTATVELRAWPRHRWWGTIFLLMAVQVGLIFWLGDRSLPVPRATATNPRVLLASELPNELQALNDPTLFAWANPRGFSGMAWRKTLPVNYESADWGEPPRWLPLPVEEPGASLRRWVQTDQTFPFQIAEKRAPQFTPSELSPPTTSMTTRSGLRVGGELAARQLLSQFDLPSWPHTDLLMSSVVQVLVDADGQTISATPLSKSGSQEADQRALELAKTARFNSLRVSGPDQLPGKVARLSWGQLIFEWHTMPIAATNPPPANP